MPRRLTSVLLAAASFSFAGTARSQPGAPPIVGGNGADVCEWPSTVLLENGLICTGTLVSSRIVLYAAHCGTDFTRVVFGESFSSGRFAPIKECQQFGSGASVDGTDFAYCELARPINGVPVAPVLFGCEGDVLTPGREVTIAGYGEDDGGQPGAKRYATTTYSGVLDDMLVIGGEGTSASFGDSGGPAFVRLYDGSWRAIGIVSGGPEPGEPVLYVDMRTTVDWVERTSGHDITPCHDADGTWNPGFECGAFATDPVAGGTWEEQCTEADPLSDRSSTCGEPHVADPEPPRAVITSPEPDLVLDDHPTQVVIDVDATDQTSDVRRVWLSVDDELVAEDEEPPFQFTVELDKGTYTLAAVAEDSGGNSGTSDEQTLYVGEEPGGCLGCRAGAGRGDRGVGDLLLIALAGALGVVTCRGRSRPRS